MEQEVRTGSDRCHWILKEKAALPWEGLEEGNFLLSVCNLAPFPKWSFCLFGFVSVHKLKCVMGLNMTVEVARLTV